MMKQKTTKRVVSSVMTTLLVLSMALILCMSALQESVAAISSSLFSPNISLLTQDIDTKREQYYDNSTIQRLPETVKDTDTISLIVQVKQEPLLDVYQALSTNMSFSEFACTDAANEVRNNILDLKTELLNDLDKTDVQYESGAFYSSILSGFEISIKAADFEETCKLFGDRANVIVSEVYNAAETQLVDNAVNVYDTGIFDSSKFGYDGTGMVVAILDTGIDYGHSAFSIDNFTADRSKLGLTFEQVEALMANHQFAAERLYSGLTASDVYVNEKIPFGFDYADYDPDVFPIKSDHGTHVSGIVAGKDDTITGVAPNAQLVEMKIFSDVQDTAIASWILTALEDCVNLGVDVINMSIGTSCGFSRESDKEALSGVYDKIREAGISLIVAASNSYSSTYGSEKNGNLGLTSNPDTGTIGSPATYEGALAVASINGAKTPYLLYNNRIMYFLESTDKVSEEKSFLDDILPDGVDGKEFEYVTIPGVGRHADYAGVDVTGKIALVKRGDITFEEKANVAQDMGAIGIIIYNNVSGDIKMNVGNITIAACSMSQDDGETLAESKKGTIKISRSQTSGPFMSDFSSWGPTPDLKIKPEITAHGGYILSSVPGQSYDRISGTSMACPNVAGATALLRQYVQNKFPGLTNVEIAKVANSLFMSTADIILNKNGLPYAVRKQGAGLASLDKAAATQAYLVTYDQSGNAMDKTKIELGADTNKTGVYELKFSIVNFGNQTLSYDISTYVLTEGVSDTKTNNGETTVTEQAYSLDGAQISISSANASGKTVTVGAGQTADVTVTVTLGASDRQYLDQSFENGMYVEGFVVLDAKEENSVDLSVPYLTFYGDWTQAPLFDLDYFQTNKDELDDSISLLDKTLPDAYATRPVGTLEGDYMGYLGSYYFLQNPSATPIAADRKYIALTNQADGINTLKSVWAGMLRNASKVDIVITDNSTGEVVFTVTDEYIRKSYGEGGDIRPAAIDIDFNVLEHNLKNNTSYTVTLKGYIDDGNDDYTDGGNGEDTNLNNTFTFPLVTDFQAPAVTDCEFYTEYDKSTEKTRLFAKIAVYDNHYSMAMQVGYVTMDSEGFILKNFDKYLTPIYSEEDATTYVIYELTDYIYEIKNSSYHKNTFTVACYDYALNQATYEIELPDEFYDIYFEKEEITLSPNEVFDLKPLVYPNTEWTELVEYTVSVPPSGAVARVVNNKLVALSPGRCQVTATITDPETGMPKRTKFFVNVLAEGEPGYVKYDRIVADSFKLTGYYIDKAFHMVNASDRLIGTTGDEAKFVGNNYSLTFYPSESVTIRYNLDAYYPDITTVKFSSSNENIVKVDSNGTITAVSEGFASISVNVLLDGRSTFYSQTISIEVKNSFVNSGPSLTHYYGAGDENNVVTFPSNLAVTEIGQFAFSNFDYVEKDTSMGDIINEDYPDLMKIWYIGDDTIKKVIIPEGVEKIGAYAFANMTALEEVVFPSTLKMIDQSAFYGCTSLRTISLSTNTDTVGNVIPGNGLKNVKLINQSAFQKTALTGKYELDSIVAIAGYAFADNKSLTGITLGKNAVSVGNYAFANNTGLANITFKSEKIKLGTGAFSGCTKLTEVAINTEVIPSNLFDGASRLNKVTLGASVAVISEYAFRGTAVDNIVIDANNKYFKVENNYILNAAGDTLALVFPTVKDTFTLDNPNVTTIGTGAFSNSVGITSVNIPSVKNAGKYAFAGCNNLSSVTLGALDSIGDYAFYNTKITKLPTLGNVTTIGKYAFASTSIKNVVIPDGMTVGEHAFDNCLTLYSVTIGNNVVIGDYAFYYDIVTHWTGEDGIVRGEDGKYRYQFSSPLLSLTIGNNSVIGKYAFAGAASLESVTLGENATIGAYAFYNASGLKNIDLSKVISIGDNAFSGDTYYVYTDSSCTIPATDANNEYMIAYYGAAFEEIDLSSLEELGEGAFAGCTALKKVILGDNITYIPDRAFLQCQNLDTINLSKVTKIGANAFLNTALTEVELPCVTEIGKYAFSECDKLVSVVLNENGVVINEGAFSNSGKLATVENLDKATYIGDYAFAYTSLTSVDLSSAEYVGTLAFAKETLTEFAVTLGENIQSFGDNPFAYCDLEAFSSFEIIEFNGKEYRVPTYTFDINDNVKVINGSLYFKVPYGLEYVCFAGEDAAEYIAEDTVRISAYAFAGSDIKSVVLPYTLKAIGHKAFFDCKNLVSVTFTSYEAPILEEEYDITYFESFDNIPATGDFEFSEGSNGATVIKKGLGIVPYFMWNASSIYSNCFYGANFVNYIGRVDTPIIMVRPSNGQHYDTFIFNWYFDSTVDGMSAADDATLAVIAAIKALPDKITLSHKAQVQAARELYDRISTLEQKALVADILPILTAAERRISDLEFLNNQNKPTPPENNNPSDPSEDNPTDNPGETPTDTPTENNEANGKNKITLIVTYASIGLVLALAIIVVITAILTSKKNKLPPDDDNDDTPDEPEDGDEESVSDEVENQEETSANEAEGSSEQSETLGDTTNEENN